MAGFISPKCLIDDTAYVGPEASVSNCGAVHDFARVEDLGYVSDYATLAGRAVVCDRASVEDNVTVCDNARVFDHAKLTGNVYVGEHARIGGVVHIGGAERFEGYADVRSSAHYISGTLGGFQYTAYRCVQGENTWWDLQIGKHVYTLSTWEADAGRLAHLLLGEVYVEVDTPHRYVQQFTARLMALIWLVRVAQKTCRDGWGE